MLNLTFKYMKVFKSVGNLDLSVYICANTHTEAHIPTPNHQQMHCLHLPEGFLDPFFLPGTPHPLPPCSTNQKPLSDETGFTHSKCQATCTVHWWEESISPCVTHRDYSSEPQNLCLLLTVLTNHLHCTRCLLQHHSPAEDELLPYSTLSCTTYSPASCVSSSEQHCPHWVCALCSPGRCRDARKHRPSLTQSPGNSKLMAPENAKGRNAG